ncbi:MAG: YkgJ family cysteine cluster protein [Planctomycetaceae bacterium]
MKAPAPESKPWYADGLKFRCTGCGNCCTGGPGAVWISDEEIQQMADHLQVSTGEFRLMYTRLIGSRLSLREYANGDCVFFDGKTRGCTIYPVRPIQCQTWPFWSSNISSENMWQHIQRNCPGAGKADLYTLEQIEEQVQRFIL